MRYPNRHLSHLEPPAGGTRCAVVESLRRLPALDLTRIDVVLCPVSLPDGSGLEALAALLARRPDLPVVMTGAAEEAARGVEAIRAGAADFLISERPDPARLAPALDKSLEHLRVRREKRRLQRELDRSLDRLEEVRREFETVVDQLERKTRTDDLTGLANRRWLDLMLEGSWAEAVRHDLPLACLMIDLDRFKRLNDEMGHQRGDEMLRLAGRVLQANCRDVDVTARYGGDEFCVLMPHTEAHEALRVAERVLGAFRAAARALAPDGCVVGMTIGLAHVDLSRPVNAEDLLAHADEALYAGKARGKSRVMVRGRDGVYAGMLEQIAGDLL